MAERTIEAVIEGRVQGVSYRAWTQATARRLGLRGWVRNEDDGSVRALVTGDPEAVAAMERALWQGPPASLVQRVTLLQAPDTDPAGFEIRY